MLKLRSRGVSSRQEALLPSRSKRGVLWGCLLTRWSRQGQGLADISIIGAFLVLFCVLNENWS